MQMPSAETDRARQERITQLRAELKALEAQAGTTPPPHVHFRTACDGVGRIATPAGRIAAAPVTDETPLPIAAG